jgi:hypothetical protein
MEGFAREKEKTAKYFQATTKPPKSKLAEEGKKYFRF